MLRVIFCDILGPAARRFDIIETFEDGDSTERHRARSGTKRTDVRPSGYFEVDGVRVPLEASPDLVDGFLGVMAEEAVKNPNLIRNPEKLLKQVIQELDLALFLQDAGGSIKEVERNALPGQRDLVQEGPSNEDVNL